ncbi:hypothetical protein PCE1_003655 [Barthelona sp. PCE]
MDPEDEYSDYYSEEDLNNLDGEVMGVGSSYTPVGGVSGATHDRMQHSRRIEDLQDEVLQLKQKLDRSQDELRTRTNETLTLKEQLTKVATQESAQTRQLQAQMRSLKKAQASSENEKALLAKKLQEQAETIKQMNLKMNRKMKEINKLENRYDQNDRVLDNQKGEITSLRELAIEKEEESLRLETELIESRQLLQHLNEKLVVLRNRLHKRDEELETLNPELEIQKKEEEFDAIMRAKDDSIKALRDTIYEKDEQISSMKFGLLELDAARSLAERYEYSFDALEIDHKQVQVENARLKKQLAIASERADVKQHLTKITNLEEELLQRESKIEVMQQELKSAELAFVEREKDNKVLEKELNDLLAGDIDKERLAHDLLERSNQLRLRSEKLNETRHELNWLYDKLGELYYWLQAQNIIVPKELRIEGLVKEGIEYENFRLVQENTEFREMSSKLRARLGFLHKKFFEVGVLAGLSETEIIGMIGGEAFVGEIDTDKISNEDYTLTTKLRNVTKDLHMVATALFFVSQRGVAKLDSKLLAVCSQHQKDHVLNTLRRDNSIVISAVEAASDGAMERLEADNAALRSQLKNNMKTSVVSSSLLSGFKLDDPTMLKIMQRYLTVRKENTLLKGKYEVLQDKYDALNRQNHTLAVNFFTQVFSHRASELENISTIRFVPDTGEIIIDLDEKNEQRVVALKEELVTSKAEVQSLTEQVAAYVSGATDDEVAFADAKGKAAEFRFMLQDRDALIKVMADRFTTLRRLVITLEDFVRQRVSFSDTMLMSWEERYVSLRKVLVSMMDQEQEVTFTRLEELNESFTRRNGQLTGQLEILDGAVDRVEFNVDDIPQDKSALAMCTVQIQDLERNVSYLKGKRDSDNDRVRSILNLLLSLLQDRDTYTVTVSETLRRIDTLVEKDDFGSAHLELRKLVGEIESQISRFSAHGQIAVLNESGSIEIVDEIKNWLNTGIELIDLKAKYQKLFSSSAGLEEEVRTLREALISRNQQFSELMSQYTAIKDQSYVNSVRAPMAVEERFEADKNEDKERIEQLETQRTIEGYKAMAQTLRDKFERLLEERNQEKRVLESQITSLEERNRVRQTSDPGQQISASVRTALREQIARTAYLAKRVKELDEEMQDKNTEILRLRRTTSNQDALDSIGESGIVSTLKAELSRIRKENEDLGIIVSTTRDKYGNLADELVAARDSLSEAKKEVKKLRRKLRNSTEPTSNVSDDEVMRLRSNLRQKESDLERAQKRANGISSLRKTIKKLKVEIKEKTEQIERLVNDNNTKNDDFDIENVPDPSTLDPMKLWMRCVRWQKRSMKHRDRISKLRDGVAAKERLVLDREEEIEALKTERDRLLRRVMSKQLSIDHAVGQLTLKHQRQLEKMEIIEE